jgi:hypothetical protein
MNDFHSFLSALTAFEAGGRGLAYAPTAGAKQIPTEALAVGGASAAVTWFRDSFKSTRPAMLFLVGAPGNGKSFLLRKVTHDLDPIGNHLGDRRRFDFKLGNLGSELIVVNDASAPSMDGNSVGPLARDLAEALDRQKFIHINVNRGVLYQELRAQIDLAPIRELLAWLSNPDNTNPNWEHLSVQPPNSHSSLRCARMFVPDGSTSREIHVVAVLMDFYSIFEVQPAHEITFSGEWQGFPGIVEGERYRIQMPGSAQRRDQLHWRETPAGQLLHGAVARGVALVPHDAHPLDPIVANILSLSESNVYCGVLSSLRNAELISSRHISFRELWTAIASLIIGDGDARQAFESAEGMRLDPLAWAKQATATVDEVSDSSRIQLMLKLAAVRSHQSIYGAIQSPFEKQVALGLSPLLSITRLADPVRDSRPNGLSTNQDFGWASPVVEAFRGQVGDESILKALELNAKEVDIQISPTAFDVALDEIVAALIWSDYNDEPLITRGELEGVLIWYGDYLTRLYALSVGCTAFEEELHNWSSAWKSAESSSRLPDATRKALVNLLLPVFQQSDADRGNHRLISYLSSRTEAVTSLEPKPRLAVEVGTQPLVRASVSGDELNVVVRDEDGTILVELAADFVLVREAMAYLERPEAMTEFSLGIVPKIERFRASMLSVNNLSAKMRVVDGNRVQSVEVI